MKRNREEESEKKDHKKNKLNPRPKKRDKNIEFESKIKFLYISHSSPCTTILG
jgi:hypothetical protein